MVAVLYVNNSIRRVSEPTCSVRERIRRLTAEGRRTGLSYCVQVFSDMSRVTDYPTAGNTAT